jgi:predicted NAD-dependent protein-ADP-ribosyltransferase YbiA (DUF1768 family)
MIISKRILKSNNIGLKNSYDNSMTVNFFKVNDQFGELSNHFLEDIEHDGTIYPSAEHLYQSLKFIYEGAPEVNSEIVRLIIGSGSSYRAELLVKYLNNTPEFVEHNWQRGILRKAKKMVKLGVVQNPEFNRLETMTWVLNLKFTQSEYCKNILLSTGDNTIVFNHHLDSYWGSNKKGGENHLGVLLGQLRENLN